MGRSEGPDIGFEVLLVDDPLLDPDVGAPTVIGAMDGSLDAGVRVALRAENGTLFEVGQPETVLLDLQATDGTVPLDVVRPSPATYVAAVVTIENATAEILAGSEIGGLTLDQDEVLDIGPTGLVVLERSFVPVTLTSQSRLSLLIDLNSEVWITQDNIADGIVDEAEVQNAVTVFVDEDATP